MDRVPRLALVAALSAIPLVAPLAAPVSSPSVDRIPSPAPQAIRDAPARNPSVRIFPVGTAVITGVVSDVDGARPVRGALVSLTGSTIGPGQRSDPGAIAPGLPRAGAPPGGGNTMSSTPSPTTLSRTTTTDDAGAFSFPRLPAGVFTITVSRSQFLATLYGQKRPGGQAARLELADGQQLKLTVPMLRGAVFTGRVVDLAGEPQVNGRIGAWRFVTNSGIRTLQQAGGATTDDRGVFRLHNLPSGNYIIDAYPDATELMNRIPATMSAIEQGILTGNIQPPTAPGLPPTVTVTVALPQPGPFDPPPGYVPTYYGGTIARDDASVVPVAGNEEKAGIDIIVQAVQGTNVHGHVALPGFPGVSVSLNLREDSALPSGTTMAAQVSADGTFTFRDLAPGKYTVSAQTVMRPPMTIIDGRVTPPSGPPPALTDDQKLWGLATVTVNGEPSLDVDIPLQRGKTISGTVVFEMEHPPDLTRQRVQVMLGIPPGPGRAIMGPLPSAKVDSDGRFTITGVMPGPYVLRAQGGGLKSSVVLGQDSLDFPFEVTGDRDISGAVVTLTDKFTALTGKLSDASGKSAFDCTVVAAPVDSRYWTPASRRIATAQPAFDSSYSFRGLPPGEYYLAVVTDLGQGEQYDPEFLKTLTSSMRVSLVEGGQENRDLRVVR